MQAYRDCDVVVAVDETLEFPSYRNRFISKYCVNSKHDNTLRRHRHSSPLDCLPYYIESKSIIFTYFDINNRTIPASCAKSNELLGLNNENQQQDEMKVYLVCFVYARNSAEHIATLLFQLCAKSNQFNRSHFSLKI